MDELLEQTISHYRITSLLGAGGMGMVYRAHDARLDRDLALKILPCNLMADENARARLIAEARTASSLNHPHIAQVYDVGEDRGHMFFAMELVEGKPLRELIQRGGLPHATVCQFGSQIANALAFAHERGVVHRDLKSANVMITPERRVKVLDFGLAKRLKDPGADDKRDPDLTASGMILGTPNYLPPEVLLGGSADARSDIWAGPRALRPGDPRRRILPPLPPALEVRVSVAGADRLGSGVPSIAPPKVRERDELDHRYPVPRDHVRSPRVPAGGSADGRNGGGGSVRGGEVSQGTGGRPLLRQRFTHGTALETEVPFAQESGWAREGL